MSPSPGTHSGSSSPTSPRQSLAVRPVYVGWDQVSPLSNEKYTPEPPTPSVNGQSVSGPALQASMSMLSLAPATTTSGWFASIATAGSFCLFCENGLGGLPFETRVSPRSCTAKAGRATSAAHNTASPAAPKSTFRRIVPFPSPTLDVMSELTRVEYSGQEPEFCRTVSILTPVPASSKGMRGIATRPGAGGLPTRQHQDPNGDLD